MKKILAALISLVLVFSLTGCGELKNAEKTVTGAFDSFKALDFEASKKFIDLNSMAIGDESSGMSTELILNNLFGKLEYEIISSEKVDSNTVLVKTKITALELEPLMQKFIGSVIEFSIANMNSPKLSEDATKKMYEDLFAKATSDPALAKKTEEVDVKVVKADGKWMIQPDEAFAAGVLGQ